uniref:EML-like second beta-propeller domain-containing protein n=1 Tax=Phytophthora ramorum TaxID=164328 RepID=H3HAS9_PHYRM
MQVVQHSSERHEQRYYQGHRRPIGCLDVNASGEIVATGDACASSTADNKGGSEIHVWNARTLQCLAVLRNFHPAGVAHVSFPAPASAATATLRQTQALSLGERSGAGGNSSAVLSSSLMKKKPQETEALIASIGSDDGASMALWNWQKEAVAVSGRAHPAATGRRARTSGSGKRPLALALNEDGDEIVVVGAHFVVFHHVGGRFFKHKKPHWHGAVDPPLHTVPACLSAVYYGIQTAVVGTRQRQSLDLHALLQVPEATASSSQKLEPASRRFSRYMLLKPQAGDDTAKSSREITPAHALDFSVDGAFLRTQHGNSTLYFWDLRQRAGTRVTSMTILRDVQWSVPKAHLAQQASLFCSPSCQPPLFGDFALRGSIVITSSQLGQAICQWRVGKELGDVQPRPACRYDQALRKRLQMLGLKDISMQRSEAPDLALTLSYVYGFNHRSMSVNQSLACESFHQVATLKASVIPSTLANDKKTLISVDFCDSSDSSSRNVQSDLAAVIWKSAHSHVHTLVFYAWKRQLTLAHTTMTRLPVLFGKFAGSSDTGVQFVSGGVDHVTFWQLNPAAGHVTAQQGVFGRHALVQTMITPFNYPPPIDEAYVQSMCLLDDAAVAAVILNNGEVFSVDLESILEDSTNQTAAVPPEIGEKRRVLLNFSSHTAPIEALDFSLDGEWLQSATSSSARQLLRWALQKNPSSNGNALARNSSGSTQVVVWKTDYDDELRLRQRFALKSAVSLESSPSWYTSPADRALFEECIRAQRSRNVFYADDAWEIVYAAGACGVVYNTKTQTQLLNYNADSGRHTVISAMAVHPKGDLVASDFSPDGHRLASIGMESDHTLAIYAISGGESEGGRLRATLLVTCKTSTRRVWGLSFGEDGELVTCGDQHILFWQQGTTSTGRGGDEDTRPIGLKTGLLTSHKECNPQATLLQIAHIPGRARIGVSSQADGSLYLWKDRADSRICVWNSQLELVRVVADIAQLNDVGLAVRDGHVLFTTSGSEVCELVEAASSQQKTLSGKAVHPCKRAQFASAGDDGTVRLWDAATRSLLAFHRWESASRFATGRPFSSDGKHLAVGTLDGVVRVLTTALDAVVTQWSCWQERQQGHGVLSLQYSLDGKLLAVGCQDGSVHVYNAASYRKITVLRGATQSADAVRLDFARDRPLLRVLCSSRSTDPELRLWDLGTWRTLPAVQVRDVHWESKRYPSLVNGTTQSEDFNGSAMAVDGHATPVTNWAVTKNEHFLLSSGGADRVSDTTMETKDSVAHAATAPTTRDINANAAEDEDEMPLLFMDHLPANFTQNAQLAAMATFMADSDDDEDQNEVSGAGSGSKQRRQSHHQISRSKRRQQPYARPLPKEKEPASKKNRDETKSSDTKELQLFLSLFHVS